MSTDSNTVETTGKTVEDAVTKALEDLEEARENVEVEVLDESADQARVRVTLRETYAIKARQVVAELLYKMGISAQVLIKKSEDPVMIDVAGDNLGLLIGWRGETLRAFQTVVNLILNEGQAVHSIYDSASLTTGGPWDYFLIGAQFRRQLLDSRIIIQIGAHQHVRNRDLHAPSPQQPYSRDRPLERPRQLRDRVVNLRPVRVDADLHTGQPRLRQTVRFRLPDHERVGLYLHAEHPGPRMRQDVEKIHPHQHFAAADGEEEDPGLGHLVEHVLDLGQRHLTVIIMVQIAMHAALVTAIGDIQLNADGNSQAQRGRGHFLHQCRHRFKTGLAADERR